IGDKIEAIISEGGRLGEPAINHSNPINKFNWETTGIHSNAYNSATSGDNARNPWDEYFFTDFYTRIHKNDLRSGNTKLISDAPMNERYEDGWYDFRVQTNRSNNDTLYSFEQYFTIDNFKPYLTEINFLSTNNISSSLIDIITRNSDEGTSALNDG